MQYRIDRIAEEIKKALSDIIRELKDPRITGIISVTGVKVTPDLRYAKVWISVLGSDTPDNVLAALKSAAGFIRHEIGNRVDIRCLPQFTFMLDHSIADGMRMSQLIDSLNRKQKKSE